jgi:hypothetical protein
VNITRLGDSLTSNPSQVGRPATQWAWGIRVAVPVVDPHRELLTAHECICSKQ